MMERKLKEYLSWKGNLNTNKRDSRGNVSQIPTRIESRDTAGPSRDDENQGISEALKRKDAAKKERAANRRRIRGGAPSQGQERATSLTAAQESGMTAKEREKLGILAGEGEMRTEADLVADL